MSDTYVENPGQADPDCELPPSKSARKREMTALQKLGESLMDMPADKFAQLPLSDRLREAFKLAKTLKQREAKRRQLQYIGKLMRAENHAEISATLSRFDDDNRLFRQRFQRLEKIRDELIEGDNNALETLLDSHPQLDRQHLRQLIRQARKEQGLDQQGVGKEEANQKNHNDNTESKRPDKEKLSQKASAVRRKLFEYLRENLTLS